MTTPLIEEWVLANTGTDGRFGVFNFYPTQAAAFADQDRANEPTWIGWGPYEPMTFDAYLAAERAHYLNQPIQEITEEHFIQMLEVLPPRQWLGHGAYESFLMSEHTSGPYTSQYVKIGGRYYTKLVDAFIRSTWIQADYDGTNALPITEK